MKLWKTSLKYLKEKRVTERKNPEDIFKVPRENNKKKPCQLGIIYTVKIVFKTEGKIAFTKKN